MKRIILICFILTVISSCKYFDPAYNPGSGLVEKTPYDRQYSVIAELLGASEAFLYRKDKGDHWQLPHETELLGAGDCEDKAIWLYYKLVSGGFDNVRLTIGNYKGHTHMWVTWNCNYQSFILDPTISSHVLKYNKNYVPFFSYFKDKKWEHDI